MKIFRKWHNAGGGDWKGSNAGWVGRDDWSYIVQDGDTFYWPRTAMLEAESGQVNLGCLLVWTLLGGLCAAFWWWFGRAVLSCCVSY